MVGTMALEVIVVVVQTAPPECHESLRAHSGNENTRGEDSHGITAF